MFPSLFPYGTGAPELQNRTIKISLESHIQYLLNLENENHKFSTHHLFRFFMFNLIQRRQICRGAKLTISRSSFIKESQILNNIRFKDFKDAIKNPTSAFENLGIGNLVRQLKATSRHVMASGSSRVAQREEIFNMINYFGTPTLFFTINPAVVHHPCISLLCGKEINLDIFYNNNLPNSRDCSILVAMNPKAQVQFVQALVHATYTYLFCAKTTFKKENNDCGILGNVQTYYGCYEIAKNGMLHIHALLWLTNALDPNELVQRLKNDETFKHGLLNYLDDIIVQSLIRQNPKDCNEINDYDWDNINPCATMPPNTSDIDFENIYQRDLYKLINTCNRHVCNPACYKNDKDAANKLCRYGFPHKIINETHFDNET
jgi:hypothetical protein